METFSSVFVAPPSGPAPTAFTGTKHAPMTLNKGTNMEMVVQMATQEYAEHLRTMFRLVSSKMENWKGRINVRLDLTEGEAMDVSDAIAFVCGSPSEIVEIDAPKRGPKPPEGKRRYHITAAGYYHCVGA